ncbi:MAG TPA: LON peptidase substrate-binding domain-containing protein [Candidatus Acidoferrales bacterium]|nr:LON peptidase substrate-binding domain-containing protein [Candidatus Acidoferrales bacterium]HEV2341033.1 LON peptidase substrate-binding domain-containing protein [Candidatus Acidoferrales bacterium]
MNPKRIPVFPLDVVLFPGMSLPLHIFEPRYKQMIRRCLLEKLEFGMILAEKEKVATIGCTATIAQVVKQYPDGQMDIIVRGGRPFHVKELYDDKPYYEALAEFIEEPRAPFPPVSKELAELYDQCHWLVFNSGPQRMPTEPGISPAYFMAGSLPLDLDDKQSLLETRDELARQNQLLEQLKEWLPQLVYMNERRERARGNGHSLN